MGWIVRHKRHGVVLALLALVLQIVVAFDHVHLRGLTQHATGAFAQRTAAQANSQTPLRIPSDNDDYCATCASIFLASTASTPAPPVLLVPANFQRVVHSLKFVRPLADSLRLAFRSRAPPVA